MAKQRLHLIGNAHIDPVWLWRWPEGYQEARATLWSAIQRLDEYPETTFTLDQVSQLAWIEESDEALFERVRGAVKAGRMHVVGGWWVEPDCNIPSGESFVRQALYGQLYLLEKLGRIATEGCNLDPFGHHAQIPQLLLGSGIDSYAFLRPGHHELELPGAFFTWQSPDGSTVVACRIPYSYCSPGANLGDHIERVLSVTPPDESEVLVFYGVGNHGGGPTRETLDAARELRDGKGHHVVFSSLRRIVDELRAAERVLPVHDGDLQHHAVGCYSAHSAMKRWNRQTEYRIAVAERWNTVGAALVGTSPATEELAHAYKLLLLNQFHDTLAGTAIASAYDDARDQLGEAASIADRVFNRAIQGITSRIDLAGPEDGQPVVLFNSHPWPVRQVVEIEVAGQSTGTEMVDDQGAHVPSQEVQSTAVTAGWRRRLAVAVALPPLGYRTYEVRPTATAACSPSRAAGDLVLANEHVRLELDDSTGAPVSLVLASSGRELLVGGPHALLVSDDSDTWAHGVSVFTGSAEEFRLSEVRRLADGPVRQVVRVVTAAGESRLVEDYVLDSGASHIDVRVTLDLRHRLHLVKLRYPTSIAAAEFTSSGPYGHIRRPADGRENPMHECHRIGSGGPPVDVLAQQV